MLGPVLLIGCGGSGGKTLRIAHAAIERRLRRVGYPPGYMPAAFQFLHVDVPPKQEGSTSEFGPYLPGESYVNLVDEGIQYAAVDTALVRTAQNGTALDELVGWRPEPSAVRVAIQEGAGQYRALGRLITLRRMGEVNAHIRRAQQAFGTTEARTELDAVSGRLGHPVPAATSDRPTPLAIVVSSLAGGTGAGCFLDVCDVLRCAFPAWGDHALAVLYAPDVFSAVRGTEGIQSNAIAALGELLAGYWSSEEWETDLLRISGVPDRAFAQGGAAHPFIIGTTNSGGVSLSNPTQVYRAVGEALGMIASGPDVRENVVNFLTVNWQSNAESNPDHLGFSPANTMAALSSFGYARAGLGRERFEDYVVKRLVRDAAEFMSTGYLLSAQNMFPGEELTPDEALLRLVDHLSARFLTEARIYRGDDQDQILSALVPPDLETSWNGVRTAALNDIRELDPAVPTVWTRRILDAIAPRRSPFLTGVQGSLATSVSEWAEELPAHLVATVSSYAARYGVPVARALVEHAIAETRAGADAHLAAAQGYEEEKHWAGLVSAALPPGNHSITGQHTDLPVAVRQGAGPLWATAQSVIHRRAGEAAAELIDGFLRPLHNALAAAQNGLVADLGPQANGEPPEVLGWPQGETVPTWMHPSDIEFLLEPVSQYPRKFTELIGASVNADESAALGGPLIAARHIVTTGGFTLNERQTVAAAIVHGLGTDERDTTGRWQPRIAGRDGTPASFRVSFRVDDMLDRARAWVSRPGTRLERYLHESLADYLAERDSQGNLVSNHEARLAEFRTAFGNALKASSPLVLIDRNLYGQVHLSQTEPPVSMVVEPIPFDEGHPARPLARDLLIASRLDATRVDDLFRSSSTGSIGIISYLSTPSHPVVYQSLMEPIAHTWSKVGYDGGETFWRWCRSRPITEAVPVPTGVRQAMVRGWFTSKLLGLVDCADPQRPYRISLDSGAVASFPFPLVGRKVGRRDTLSPLLSVLESFGLAMVLYSSSGDASHLEAYRRLLELGLSDVTAFELGYDHLGETLEDWIARGTVVHGLVEPVVEGADDRLRLESVLEVLETSRDAYQEIADMQPTAARFFELPRVHELASEAASCLGEMANAAARDKGPGRAKVI